MRPTLIEILLAAATVAIGVGVGFVYYIGYQTPIIELQKNEWDCVLTEPAIHLQPLPMGKTIVPMPSGACVEYRLHK